MIVMPPFLCCAQNISYTIGFFTFAHRFLYRIAQVYWRDIVFLFEILLMNRTTHGREFSIYFLVNISCSATLNVLIVYL